MQTELELEELGTQIRDINYKQVIQSEQANIQRNIVRNLLLEYPEGITDTEICIMSGIQKSSVTARRNEIKGMVAVSVAQIIYEDGSCHPNTMWSVII